MPRFASVFLDVDSTLCGVEGIDFLAQRRGPDVAARVTEATERAMRGSSRSTPCTASGWRWCGPRATT
jgi:phosphoserine phosphatase